MPIPLASFRGLSSPSCLYHMKSMNYQLCLIFHRPLIKSMPYPLLCSLKYLGIGHSNIIWEKLNVSRLVFVNRQTFMYSFCNPIYVLPKFSYAVDREGISPSRDYPKPWLDYLNEQGCVNLQLTYTYLPIFFFFCKIWLF